MASPRAAPPARKQNTTSSSSSSVSISSLELSDAKVYAPEIRARLGTNAHFCKVGVPTSLRLVRIHTVTIRIHQVMSLEYEPASKPLHISIKLLFFNRSFSPSGCSPLTASPPIQPFIPRPSTSDPNSAPTNLDPESAPTRLVPHSCTEASFAALEKGQLVTRD